jgi:methylated-DNA-[protein]-cysteine S-methyltransferase
MQKVIKYVVFKTNWGYFGLAGTEFALFRTCLPGPKPEKIKSLLLKNLLSPNQDSSVKSRASSIEFDTTFFKTIQEQITAYFKGSGINFSLDIPITLDGFSGFSLAVLTACRNIRFGRTITYAGLAKRAGRPAASRAVGNALAKNPLPLIIPCHRIIRSDGKTGGFSAPGGITLKKRILEFEHRALRI